MKVKIIQRMFVGGLSHVTGKSSALTTQTRYLNPSEEYDVYESSWKQLPNGKYFLVSTTILEQLHADSQGTFFKMVLNNKDVYGKLQDYVELIPETLEDRFKLGCDDYTTYLQELR